MPGAPLRILCNKQNLIRTATLTPSSVMPAENTVLQTPAARIGTGGVTLTGAYTGSEDATLDVQIIDADADTKRASTPVLEGQGTGTLSGITVGGGFAAQEVTVELKDAGIPIVSAAIDFEGGKLVAAQPGADGNDISLNVEQGIETSPAGLVFEATAYSLLVDVAAGQGGPTTALVGPGFDWGQPTIGEDGVIPAGAPRVAFGDDRTVYTAYKQFAVGAWGYYLVPALLRAVPKGTPIKFVTGGRIVTITDASTSPLTVETYANVETVYDLLSQIREGSAVVRFEGIVANDRTPTGQAARELLVRTDAHVEPSSGTGSRYATGVESAFAEADAATELVTARCYAVTGKDHPLAHLGAERWAVEGSLSGKLADAVTGVPYVAAKFGFLIPRKLPPGYGSPKGSIGATVSYVGRNTGESEPPICPVALTLGADPSDQTVTYVYRRRPNGDCACDSLPVPHLSETCLGLLDTGDDAMSYSADALTRLRALYDWAAELGAAVTQYVGGLVADGIPETGVGYTAEFSGSRTGLGGTTLSIPADATAGTVLFGADIDLVTRYFASFGLPLDFQALVDTFELAIQAIDELDAGTPKTDAWTEWDAALAAAAADLLAGSPQSYWATIAVDKYKLMLRKALAYGGISPLGKSSASILESGDGCWRDWGGAYWWEAQSGGYAPMFSNKPYISSRRASENGKYYSTHEFGFQANIACEQYLKEGDAITIEIKDAARPSTYQVGDEITQPIVAASDLQLAGGQDGNTVQIWNLRGSIAGPLANYTLDTAAPSAYSASGLDFEIIQGGIPFVIGDKFTFAIEGGHFRWRVNGGAWNVDSPLLDIPDAPLLLYEGLSVTFTPGAAPSFAADDLYSFRILQPRAVSNARTPGPEAWQWVNDGQSRIDNLGSVQTIKALAVAFHTLPAGATVTVEGADTLDSPFVPAWSVTLDRREGPICHFFTDPPTAGYIVWTINGAPDATIGYTFAGDPITTARAADLNLSRAWKIDRGAGGLYGGGRYLGKAVSGELEWTEGTLPEADVTMLQSMLDWVKQHDDEAIIIVPNVTRPGEAFLGRAAVDEVEWPDISMYQANADKARRHETRIPVAGVWS